MSLEPKKNADHLDHSNHPNQSNHSNHSKNNLITPTAQKNNDKGLLAPPTPISAETQAKNKKLLFILLAVVFGFFISVFLKFKR